MVRKFTSLNLSNRYRIGITCVALLCMVVSALVVVNPWGAIRKASAASNAQVTVNANQSLGMLTNTSKGLNTAVWDSHMLDSASISAVKNAGINILRYPGGSTSDVYHWQTNSGGGNNTFDAFMSGVQSIGAQAIITTDYGSGTPQEAAGWVQYANKGGSSYNGPVPSYSGASRTGHNYGIKYWEVGNEVYGNGLYGGAWENDTHTHTSATYASNVVAFSQAMKAVDSSISVGAVVTTPGNWPDGVTNSASPQSWNTTVLSTACSSIDFVIPHWYPQGPGSESDAGLLGTTSKIASMVSTLRSEINQYCGAHASAVKIMLTETNSVSSNPGKQTTNTVNALYLADDYPTWLENGVANVDWWTLHNGAVAANNSSSLYGSSNFGDYGVLANGGCAPGCEPAPNTPLPAYYGLQMLGYMGTSGDTMVSSSSNQSLVAVHAIKQANGKLAVLLINKDPNNSYTVSLGLNGYSASSNATVYTYGENSSSITSATGSSSSATIAPYSLTLVVLSPGSGDGNPTPVPTTGGNPTPTPTSGGFTPTAGAYYRIVNRNSGQDLEISNLSTANGGLADQRTNSNGANQQWSFVASNGGYKLVNHNSGLLLDDPANSKTTGTQLDQWSDTNGSNQWWNIVSAGGGYYSLVNQGSGLYADVTGASTTAGAAVIQWTGNGGNNQQWSFVQVGGSTPTPTPTSTSPTPTPTSPTPTPPPSGFTPTAGAHYRIVNRNSGQDLEITSWSTANGGLVDQWTNSNGANQEWSFVASNGGYKLINLNSGLLLDDPANSKTTGTQLDQWSDTNGSNQWWNIVSAGGGYYSLVNQGSGLYADVSTASTTAGAAVIQWTGPGGTNQQWSFVQV